MDKGKNIYFIDPPIEATVNYNSISFQDENIYIIDSIIQLDNDVNTYLITFSNSDEVWFLFESKGNYALLVANKFTKQETFRFKLIRLITPITIV